MSTENLKESLLEALEAVQSSAPGQSVVARGQIQNLDVNDDGEARFAFFLAPDDPGTLVKDVRAAAEAADGIASVRVNVQLPQTGAAPSGAGSGRPEPGSVPAPTPTPNLLPKVARVVAVSSGKGGVGKSMVAVNLGDSLLTVCELGFGKRTPIDEYRRQKRGGSGLINIKTTERNGQVVAAKTVSDSDELMMITAQGIIMRFALKDIRPIGRNTQGVRMIRVYEGDTLVAVARVVADEDDDDEQDNGDDV